MRARDVHADSTPCTRSRRLGDDAPEMNLEPSGRFHGNPSGDDYLYPRTSLSLQAGSSSMRRAARSTETTRTLMRWPMWMQADETRLCNSILSAT